MDFLAQSQDSFGIVEIIVGIIIFIGWLWNTFIKKNEGEEESPPQANRRSPATGSERTREEEERVRRIREEIQRRRSQQEGATQSTSREVSAADRVRDIMERHGMPGEAPTAPVERPQRQEPKPVQQQSRRSQTAQASSVERRLEEQRRRLRESEKQLRVAEQRAGAIGGIADSLVGQSFEYAIRKNKRRSASHLSRIAREAVYDPKGAQKAFLMAEILGPPIALRPDHSTIGPISDME